MKHDAKWFFNFFNQKDNWCSGNLYDGKNYCAVGHLNTFEGIIEDACRYNFPLHLECNEILGVDVVTINDATDNAGEYLNPKKSVLQALRRAILKEDPQCQLGKEYDNV